MFYLFVALVLSIIANIVQVYLHYKEKDEVFNRFMARDYREYRYFKEEYPKEVDLATKEKKEEIKIKQNPQERLKMEMAKRF
ncbi:MAG: hypothetical protein J7L26_12515 [Candidatus Aminicenantes bacterium]|nr:hypothetical protein [Candidatus Aminicenantes bacterium]